MPVTAFVREERTSPSVRSSRVHFRDGPVPASGDEYRLTEFRRDVPRGGEEPVLYTQYGILKDAEIANPDALCEFVSTRRRAALDLVSQIQKERMGQLMVEGGVAMTSQGPAFLAVRTGTNPLVYGVQAYGPPAAVHAANGVAGSFDLGDSRFFHGSKERQRGTFAVTAEGFAYERRLPSSPEELRSLLAHPYIVL